VKLNAKTLPDADNTLTPSVIALYQLLLI